MKIPRKTRKRGFNFGEKRFSFLCCRKQSFGDLVFILLRCKSLETDFFGDLDLGFLVLEIVTESGEKYFCFYLINFKFITLFK